jgi:CRP/FNR family transcriptional regulator, anaerobic regulatory protein
VKGFYCIQSGLIRIYKKTGSGKELTFGIKTRGHWLGFREVVSDIEFNHSAICLEEAEICFIPKETMQRLIKSDEVFQVEIMQYLANEWRIMENNIYSMGTKQIHSRLAELLITLYGISDRKDSEIHIKMSREIMATCIGTTKESLIRAMSDFRDRNWIRVEDNKIEIMNLEALYHLSEL